MNWMWIATGLVAALAAMVVLRIFTVKMRKQQKTEISIMATVKRVVTSKQEGMKGIFIACGQEIEFVIPAEIARQLQPGEKGILTYRGTEFVYFVPRQQKFETEDDLKAAS